MARSQNSFIKKKKADKKQKKQKEKLENRIERNKLKNENTKTSLDDMMITLEEAKALRQQKVESEESKTDQKFNSKNKSINKNHE